MGSVKIQLRSTILEQSCLRFDRSALFSSAGISEHSGAQSSRWSQGEILVFRHVLIMAQPRRTWAESLSCFSLFCSLHLRDQQKATPQTTKRKWKVGKVLECFCFLSCSYSLTLSVSHPVKVYVSDCSDWQACWGSKCVSVLTVVCLATSCVCVCVLADSSALSQSSATEEMPPLLPSPQSSPASKCIHGNQKLYGRPWQGPDTPPPPPPLPILPPPLWLLVVTGNDVLHVWAPHSDPPSFF